MCKHQNDPLGEGKIVDGCVTCPWHGYDGKTVLEVPETENRQMVVEKMAAPLPERPVEILGSISLLREIIDPKCYFGVMKPDYGKVHRSCAIRCIAGGIPQCTLEQVEDWMALKIDPQRDLTPVR